MKNILWKLLEWLDDNHGYSTPIQKRFRAGDKVKVSIFKVNADILVGEPVLIIETSRHDYLVQDDDGKRSVVYQFELEGNA